MTTQFDRHEKICEVLTLILSARNKLSEIVSQAKLNAESPRTDYAHTMRDTCAIAIARNADEALSDAEHHTYLIPQ
jgi:hypothetical protein